MAECEYRKAWHPSKRQQETQEEARQQRRRRTEGPVEGGGRIGEVWEVKGKVGGLYTATYEDL